MAWVRCCGGSANKANNFYKNGVLNLPISFYNAHPSGFPGVSTSGSGTITNTSNILSLNYTASAYNGSSFISADIDVTNLTQIMFDVNAITGSNNSFYVGFTQSTTNNYAGTNRIGINTTGVHYIDCSNLSGNYKLFFYLETGVGSNASCSFNSIIGS